MWGQLVLFTFFLYGVWTKTAKAAVNLYMKDRALGAEAQTVTMS